MRGHLTTAVIATAMIIALVPRGASAQGGSVRGLGIGAGMNFASLGDVTADGVRASFEHATGWHVHLWLDLPLGPVAVRPGIRFMDMGRLVEDATIADPATAISDDNARLLEVPVDVRLRIGLPAVTPYAMLGPVLRFNAGSDDADRFRSFSLAGGAGVGLELSLIGLTLFPELKYTFGITQFTERSYELGGVTITPDEDQRLNAVMLSVGIRM